MPIVLITLVFLILTGVLWYERPPGGIWFGGSLALATAWGTAFFWLITRPRK
jgi:hypothetical protein